MTRMRIAIAAALCFTASTVYAQNTHFIVSTPSASVYKAPTNVSPVVGEAKQGATLEVTRDVGSWVKVAWSNAPDGVGYIRKSAGTMGALGPAVPATKAASAPAAASRRVPRRHRAFLSPSATGGGAHGLRGADASLRRAPGRRLRGGRRLQRGWSSSQKFGVDRRHPQSMANGVLHGCRPPSRAARAYAFRAHVSDSTWVVVCGRRGARPRVGQRPGDGPVDVGHADSRQPGGAS
jgi:hypothetical protein